MTKGKDHLDVFFYISVVYRFHCNKYQFYDENNNVIPKLKNFKSTLLTTTASELNPFPCSSFFIQRGTER